MCKVIILDDLYIVRWNFSLTYRTLYSVWESIEMCSLYNKHTCLLVKGNTYITSILGNLIQRQVELFTQLQDTLVPGTFVLIQVSRYHQPFVYLLQLYLLFTSIPFSVTK